MFGINRDKRFEEIDEYRDLLRPPDSYEEGFTTRTIAGALFIAIVMVPGNMYLSLMIGGSIGAAAEWVTVILFIEIAKRSFTTLKKQEIYLLLYVATALIAAESGAFSGLLWNQYFVQSPAALQFGVARYIPWWVAPQPESLAIIERTFFHPDWLVPIILLVAGMVVGKIASFTGGYFLFRVTSDYERLPFPFAPIAAQGAMALAEESSGEEGWRWRVFSIGAAIGAAFGAIYVAVPAITGVLLTRPVQLLPIPWVDLTQYTGYFLPATPLGFTCHLGPIFAGLVAPFWGIVGAFLGVVIHTLVNPILHHHGMLPHWFEGMDTIQTQFVNYIDFWMSFGIGITIALTIIGIWQVVSGVHAGGADERGKRSLDPPKGRGDFRLAVILGLFALTSVYPIIIAKIFFPMLVGKYLIGLFFLFAFIYTPIVSFINARLIGMVGMTVTIPYIRESIIFLSGYRGVDIWFVPMGIGDYSGNVQKFREIELSGTKFTSFVKAELFMVPLVLVMGLVYSSLLWKMAPIPSPSYPYINTMWPLQALTQSIWLSSTLRGELEIAEQETSWRPGNLQDQSWWYWRARARSGERVGPWTEVGEFYTDWHDNGPPPRDIRALPPPPEADVIDPALRLQWLGPAQGTAVDTPTPALLVSTVEVPADLSGDSLQVEYEIDTSPTFDSISLQSSSDRPILFEALKAPVIAAGLAVGLGMFWLLSFFGLPVLFVFGYVRSMNQIPHMMITEILGALLARYYFWKRFGRQQWRLYATVLAVGFSVGMGLMGMISVAFAMIQKAVNVLAF
jgi:hypothetical protein